jgi:hypothetical protein
VLAHLDPRPLEVFNGAGQLPGLLAQTRDNAEGLVPIREAGVQSIHDAIQPLEVVRGFLGVAPQCPMRRTLRSMIAKVNNA